MDLPLLRHSLLQAPITFPGEITHWVRLNLESATQLACRPYLEHRSVAESTEDLKRVAAYLQVSGLRPDIRSAVLRGIHDARIKYTTDGDALEQDKILQEELKKGPRLRLVS